jgi:hypothetical protein
MILMAAGGMSNDEITIRLDTCRQVVSLLRKRSFKERLSGLEEGARPGRPRAAVQCESACSSLGDLKRPLHPPTPDAGAKLALVISGFKAAIQTFMVLGVRMAAVGRVEAKQVSNCSPQTGHPAESKEKNLDGTANGGFTP